MKPLQNEFKGRTEVKGVIFKLICRHNDICLYGRSDGVYEVIRTRKQKETKVSIGGVEVFYAAQERYPKGDSFTQGEVSTRILSRAVAAFNRKAAELKYDFVLTEAEALSNMPDFSIPIGEEAGEDSL